MTMMSAVWLSCLLIAQAPPPKITENYDKFRDILTTNLDLGKLPVAGPGRARIEVEFHRHTKGPDRKPSSPEDRVSLHLSASNDSWRYLKYHPIILLIDGKRLDLGEQEHRGDVGNGYVLEQFICPFTVAQAAELGRAATHDGTRSWTPIVTPRHAKAFA